MPSCPTQHAARRKASSRLSDSWQTKNTPDWYILVVVPGSQRPARSVFIADEAVGRVISYSFRLGDVPMEWFFGE